MGSRVGFLACGSLILGLWIPWGQLSIGLFGGDPAGIGEINGQEIGSGIVDLPVGWIAAGAGIAGAIGLYQWRRNLTLAAGLVSVAVTGYTFLAIPGTETTTSGGEDVSGLISGQVDYAWGLFVVTAASIALAVIGWRMESPVDDEESMPMHSPE